MVEQILPEVPAPSSLFAVDLGNVEIFLELIGDKRIRYSAPFDTFELVPAPTRSNALANELAASMVSFIRHAYWASCEWPGKDASRPYACDECGHYRFQTAQRAKTKCSCGSKGTKRLLEIPWAESNRYNRPPAPWPKSKPTGGKGKPRKTDPDRK